MGEQVSVKKSTIKLFNRSELEIEGALGVLSFDNDFLSVKTVDGDLDIEGEMMIIEDLSKSGSSIIVKGQINALVYHLDSKKKRSIFG